MINSGIYAIRNLVTGKMYVGSAIDFAKRFKNHRSALTNGKHNPKLQNSWNKHGAGAFVFEILEVVEDKALLLTIEQQWLDKFKSYGPAGYNVALFASAPMRGRKRSAVSIEKTAAAHRGTKRGVETIKRMSAWQKGQKKPAMLGNKNALGYQHTEAARAKIAFASKNISA